MNFRDLYCRRPSDNCSNYGVITHRVILSLISGVRLPNSWRKLMCYWYTPLSLHNQEEISFKRQTAHLNVWCQFQLAVIIARTVCCELSSYFITFLSQLTLVLAKSYLFREGYGNDGYLCNFIVHIWKQYFQCNS